MNLIKNIINLIVIYSKIKNREKKEMNNTSSFSLMTSNNLSTNGKCIPSLKLTLFY